MDLNGDGFVDLLSGSYSGDGLEEMAGLFQVLWGTDKGGFKKAEPLKGTDEKPLIIDAPGEENVTERICTRPTAVDWDADGDLDLLVGNFTGTFYLFKGEGKGRFEPKSEKVMLGKHPLRIMGAHSDPFCIDWDGDGDLDILTGASEGGVFWSENTAGPGKPITPSSFEIILLPKQKKWELWADEPLTDASGSTRVWADDVNSDGKLDLLVGDRITLLAPSGELTKKEAKKRLQTWEKDMRTLSKKRHQAQGEEESKLSQQLSKHWKAKSKIVEQDSTGFVWVYVQK